MLIRCGYLRLRCTLLHQPITRASNMRRCLSSQPSNFNLSQLKELEHEFKLLDKPIIVYNSNAKKSIQILGTMTVLQNLAMFCAVPMAYFYPVDGLMSTPVTSIIFLGSLALTHALNLYAARNVSRLQLMPGGKNVRVHTFTLWGAEKPFSGNGLMPINEIMMVGKTVDSLIKGKRLSSIPVKIATDSWNLVLDRSGTYTNARALEYVMKARVGFLCETPSTGSILSKVSRLDLDFSKTQSPDYTRMRQANALHRASSRKRGETGKNKL